jgi:alkanesulfonate monooxygenase
VCDGFVVSPVNHPGMFEQFCRSVVPELQRRGLFRTEYEGKTLRENLGLPRPENRFFSATAKAAE